MGIQFPNIPAGLKIPLFHLEFANGGIGGQVLQNTLLIGNTITAQSAVPVFVPSVAQAVALFGARSLLAAMVQKLLKSDPFASLWCLPFADNGAGAAATGNISFTGPATAAGTLALYIAGRSVPVAVTNTMTAAALATAVVAAITNYVDSDGVSLPVTAAIDGTHNYQVNLTAANKGTHGNYIDVRLNYYGTQGSEALPAGLTAVVTAMSGGATDPVITGLDAILGDTNYDFIAHPWSTTGQIGAFTTLMANATGRWSWTRQVYGHVFAAKMDADATGATNITFGQSLNDPHHTVLSYEPAPPPPWDVAASLCGAAASSLRADPARPLQTLTLPGLLSPPSTGRYTKATQQALLSSGMALMGYNQDGSCAIVRCVTTYQKNPAGTPDISYLDAETAYTAMAFVRQLKGDVTTTFPRAKLADDGTNFGAGTTFTNGAPDQPITTPKGIRAVIIASYAKMIDKGWVEDMASFQRGLIVQRNATDPSRVDTLVDPVFVSGMRIFAALVQFFLQSPSTGSAASS